MRRVLVDTGPLVALLNADDAHHRWVGEVLASLRPPLLTCEAVITEACFLCRKTPPGSAAVLGLVDRGVVRIAYQLDLDLADVRRLMDRYADLPMSLADACLVRMTELEPDSVVLTMASHFRIYRRHDRQLVPTIMPE